VRDLLLRLIPFLMGFVLVFFAAKYSSFPVIFSCLLIFAYFSSWFNVQMMKRSGELSGQELVPSIYGHVSLVAATLFLSLAVAFPKKTMLHIPNILVVVIGGILWGVADDLLRKTRPVKSNENKRKRYKLMRRDYYYIALERMNEKQENGMNFQAALLESADEINRFYITREPGAIDSARNIVLAFMGVTLIKHKMKQGLALASVFKESVDEARQLYVHLAAKSRIKHNAVADNFESDWTNITAFLSIDLTKQKMSEGKSYSTAMMESNDEVFSIQRSLVQEAKIAGGIKPQGTPESREAHAVNAAGGFGTIHDYENWLDAMDKKVYLYNHAVHCEFGPGLVIPLQECQSREQIIHWGVDVVRAMRAHKAYRVPVERTLPHFVDLVRQDRPYEEVEILCAEILAIATK
jgi:VanZ family protein